MPEIIEKLNTYGVNAERKSIYDDFEYLRHYGLDINGIQKDKNYFYYIGSREFELPELKLLVDSVQAAKFITEKKSNELIKKLESYTSKYKASQLQRQVFMAERAKTMNENIYINVDVIHGAIASNRKVKFQYWKWNVQKEMELRKDGAFYVISPWALTWADENYYMIGYDSEAGMIKHYRVDKMIKMEEVRRKREGKDCFKEFDMAVYDKKMFGMYGGKEETVCINCTNDLAGSIIDRFGKDVMMYPVDSEHFEANVKVVVSSHFIHWVMALGKGAKIIGPENVVEQVKCEINRLSEEYI